MITNQRKSQFHAWFRRTNAEILPPLVVAVLGALLAILFPEDLALLTRALIAAIFVISLALVMGICGIVTLGHAVVYGVGAYAAGYICTRVWPDPHLMIIVGIIAGALAGFLSGVIVARARGLQQLVLSIALVQLFHEVANKASGITGGSDGLSNILPGKILGYFIFDLWGVSAYVLCLIALVITLAFSLRLVSSPFGLLCRAIHADEIRVRFIGASIYGSLLRMYVISGAIGGLAGALLAISTSVVGLDSISFEWSAEAVVMLALGGASQIYGAIAGATIFVFLKHVVSVVNPFHWLIAIGIVLIGVVFTCPDGIAVSISEKLSKWRKHA